MPLTPDQIAALYSSKKSGPRPAAPKAAQGKAVKTNQKKFIRLARHYPRLPEDGNVVRVDSMNLHCASRGCRGATCYKYKGIPYCNTHLIYYLSIENNELTKQQRI